jgi:hypothetical protein
MPLLKSACLRRGFILRTVDVEITPEPTEAERQAILAALRLDADVDDEPSPWRRAALESDED